MPFWPGQDNGRVGFGPQRRDGSKQGADAGAVHEGGGGEIDHEVAMAAADLAGYCVFQSRCEREVELPCHADEGATRAEGCGGHR